MIIIKKKKRILAGKFVKTAGSLLLLLLCGLGKLCVDHRRPLVDRFSMDCSFSSIAWTSPPSLHRAG